MENPPFEDVFPIQDGDFPASYVCLPEGRELEDDGIPQDWSRIKDAPSKVKGDRLAAMAAVRQSPEVCD